MSQKVFSFIFLGVGLLGVVIYTTVTMRYKHPNIMLILLDTVRADHLGSFGYERNTSPTLDEFLKRNWNFRNAFSAAPWTPASVASIFTGLYPSAHGFMPPNREVEAVERGARLAGKAHTVADILAQNGYFTAAVISNPWLKRGFGLNRGFKGFWYIDRGDAKQVNRQTFRVLRRLKEQRAPFFLYIHYMDPHTPYTPPPPYDSLFRTPLRSAGYSEEMQRKMSLYDGEIRYLDDGIRDLFGELKRLELWKDLVVVIVSDHGEQFEEHGQQGHGFNLQNEELHVLFAVKAPGRRRQEGSVVSLVDVLPTVLDLAQKAIPAGLDGTSLVSHRRDRGPVLSEIKRIRNMKSITDQTQKRMILEYGMERDVPMTLHDSVKADALCYDVSKDYFGQTPLSDDGEAVRLKREFSELYRQTLSHRIAGKAAAVDVSPDTVEELRSLGYF